MLKKGIVLELQKEQVTSATRSLYYWDRLIVGIYEQRNY